MFRSKNISSKESGDKKDHDKMMSSRNTEDQREKVLIDVDKMETICYKKCIYALNTPGLSHAEKSCLDRCACKFKEAIDYGHNLLQYINYKVRESNKTQ